MSFSPDKAIKLAIESALPKSHSRNGNSCARRFRSCLAVIRPELHPRIKGGECYFYPLPESGMTNDFLLNTHGGVLPKLKLPNCPQSEELERRGLSHSFADYQCIPGGKPKIY